MRVGMRGRAVRSMGKSTLRFLSVLIAGILFWPTAVHSQGVAEDITCEDGSGEYSTRFFTGTTVSVGSMRNGAFAERACAVSTSAVVGYNTQGGAPDASQLAPPLIHPRSILLRRPPPSAQEPEPSANEMVELVVDAAGKVHSAKVINGTDEPLVKASAGWQFIPAFSDGRAVRAVSGSASGA
jgi:hypothetical protein